MKLSDRQFYFGKYKGKSLAEVHKIDPEYLVWCSTNLDGAMQALVNRFLAPQEWVLISEVARRLNIKLKELKHKLRRDGYLETVVVSWNLLDHGTSENTAEVPSERAHEMRLCKKKRGAHGTRGTYLWNIEKIKEMFTNDMENES